MKLQIASFFAFQFSLTYLVCLSDCIEFNRATTGVEFSAYVKRRENGTDIPGWKTYTVEDMKTMLTVISQKFSRINTYGVGADNVPYYPNKTYYDSNAIVTTGEAAALLNRERQSKSLTVLVGIYLSNEKQQTKTEAAVALESYKLANEIYPGTVEGFVMSHHEIGQTISRTKQALRLIKSIRNESMDLDIKLGCRQKCYGMTSDPPDEEDKLKLLQQEIVKESDFIICESAPAPHNLLSGPKYGFLTVGNDLLGFREELHKLNPNIEVMGQTKWASKGDKPWENVENMKDYWLEADKWASLNNFTMWLLEAFDNPWKDWGPTEGHYGWWRLKRNDDTSTVEGYAEKIIEGDEIEIISGKEKDSDDKKHDEKPDAIDDKKREERDNTSPWVYVGIAVGVIVALLVLAMITMLFMRVNKLQEALTKDDVREFMYGMSDDAAAQQGDIVESALKFPYDKSYEIPKEKLKIRKEHLLGTGQFGSVYKALLENDEMVEVALKMAKHDCPKSALKGLLSEIKILTYLGKHPNIVSIQGAYTAEILNGIVYVATELCSLGSLESYLRNSSGTSNNENRYANAPGQQETQIYINAERREITFKEMLKWSHEIACGMEYLGTKHVVHADLATRNVLLGSDKTAKITDFGLSRRLYDYTNYVKQQQEPLPWRWMAIESLKRLEFSSKSDVWSYGVTLWEIFALGDLPYPGLSWNLDFVDSLVNGLRMKCPPHATKEVYQIMVDCWHIEPHDRPTFTDLKLSTGKVFGGA